MGSPSHLKEQNKTIDLQLFQLTAWENFQVEPGLPELWRQNWDLGTLQHTEFAGQSPRKKKRAEQREVQKCAEGPQVFSKMPLHAWMWGN